jgi:hypothetical protein
MLRQGRPLNAAEFELYQPYFQSHTLKKARLIEAHPPFWLSKKMCAVVLGHRIYFREHVYQFNTAQGIELLAHELMHVEQYLSGMSIFKYLWAARRGYRLNPYEVEAYAKGAEVKAHLAQAQSRPCD